MTIYDKIIANADNPANGAIGKVIEKASGTAAVGGAGVATVADKTQAIPDVVALPEIASIVGIVGSLVWISKNLFDGWLSYLKHRHDGVPFPPWYQNPFIWIAGIAGVVAAYFLI